MDPRSPAPTLGVYTLVVSLGVKVGYLPDALDVLPCLEEIDACGLEAMEAEGVSDRPPPNSE